MAGRPELHRQSFPVRETQINIANSRILLTDVSVLAGAFVISAQR